MNVRVELASESERPIIRNLMQAYEHDLSEFTGDVPGQDGLFSIGNYFDVYWTEKERHPFEILYKDQPVGFALVRELEDGAFSMSEFFVVRSLRRKGVGKLAATMLFDRFPGTWHVAQDENNAPAQSFWRSIIGEYTDGEYSEQQSDAQPRGPKQVFRSRRV